MNKDFIRSGLSNLLYTCRILKKQIPFSLKGNRTYTQKTEEEISDRIASLVEKKIKSIHFPVQPLLVSSSSFTCFAYSQINLLLQQNRKRTACNYRTALNALISYLGKEEITFNEITSEQLLSFQNSLSTGNKRNKEITPGTISCYMRSLRSLYNEAIKQQLTPPQDPFRQVYTKIPQTSKRAITATNLQKLMSLNLEKQKSRCLARDLFLFSFLTHGMSFIDMAYLKREQIQNGYIVYRRHKTRQEIRIRLNEQIHAIIQRYANPNNPYVFPIITRSNPDEADKQYRSKGCYYNKLLKEIGKKINSPVPLTFHVARHTWASLAYNDKASIETISKALGHTSTRTTLIYIKSIESNKEVDKINSKLLEKIFF